MIVIFWSRMGTPLPEEYVKDDGARPYLSGTEWEYLDAKRAAEGAGRPKILVYRRTESVGFVLALETQLISAFQLEKILQFL